MTRKPLSLTFGVLFAAFATFGKPTVAAPYDPPGAGGRKAAEIVSAAVRPVAPETWTYHLDTGKLTAAGPEVESHFWTVGPDKRCRVEIRQHPAGFYAWLVDSNGRPSGLHGPESTEEPAFALALADAPRACR
jgi:hypothetical protein